MKNVAGPTCCRSDFSRDALSQIEPKAVAAEAAPTIGCSYTQRLVLLLLFWLPLVAGAGVPPPMDLNQRAGFDQRLGAQLSMTLPFRDADGHSVTLAELADGKPTLLALGYYRCPNLC